MLSKLVEEDAFMDTPPSAECKPGHEIWALAEELSMSTTEWSEQIEAAQEMLNDLAKLGPYRTSMTTSPTKPTSETYLTKFSAVPAYIPYQAGTATIKK